MRYISFDKTEIVVMDTSAKNPKVFNLTFADIMRFPFRPSSNEFSQFDRYRVK